MTGNGSNVVEEYERGLAYTVRIRICHPSDPLDCLTTATGLTPHVQHKKGEPRVTPNGVPLPGTYSDSRWSYSEVTRDSRRFHVGVRRAMDLLEPAAEVLQQLRTSGGRVEIILHLRGERNVGDYIEIPDLKRLADLGINLGVEVFPHTND